jgi:hypothetical protein
MKFREITKPRNFAGFRKIRKHLKEKVDKRQENNPPLRAPKNVRCISIVNCIVI